MIFTLCHRTLERGSGERKALQYAIVHIQTILHRLGQAYCGKCKTDQIRKEEAAITRVLLYRS